MHKLFVQKASECLQYGKMCIRDRVLTTFGPLTPHMIALRLRRNGYKFYWIADMRDEMSKNILVSRYRTKRLIPYERKIVNSSDLVVSVSEPLLKDFKRDVYKRQVFDTGFWQLYETSSYRTAKRVASFIS